MSKLSSGTTSGLLVMVAGFLTLGALFFGVPRTESTLSTEALLVVDSTPVFTGAPSPEVAGLEASIQRVLESTGKLETFDPNAISTLAPEVARVLAYYGATLTIPVAAETGS